MRGRGGDGECARLSSLKGTDAFRSVPTPMTSSNPNHLLKAPPSNSTPFPGTPGRPEGTLTRVRDPLPPPQPNTPNLGLRAQEPPDYHFT